MAKSWKNFKLKLGSMFNVSIRAKLITLAGTLLVVLIASNLNLRFEIAAGGDALR